MTHAQRIYLMGNRLMHVLRKAGIDVSLSDRVLFYAKIERWCVLAQQQENPNAV